LWVVLGPEADAVNGQWIPRPSSGNTLAGLSSQSGSNALFTRTKKLGCEIWSGGGGGERDEQVLVRPSTLKSRAGRSIVLSPWNLLYVDRVYGRLGSLGGAGAVSQSTNWRVATRVTTAFQTRPEVSRSFGESMAGGGGHALLVVRHRAHLLDHS
jgi:hypothetical protein